MSELNYVVLNPIHSTFQLCPMIIDPKNVIILLK